MFTILACRSARSQVLPFQSYSSRDGLVSDAVTCILQDSRGFIWIGTNDGLSKYDGASFTNYAMNEGLPPAAILCLAEGPDGTLWMGTTYEGVVRFRDGVFKTMRLDSIAQANYVTRILVDHNGNAWCQTRAGLFIVHADSVYRIQDELEKKYGFDPDRRPWTFVCHESDTLLWLSDGKRFVRYSPGRTSFAGEPFSVPSSAIHPVEGLLDKDGNLWIVGSLNTGFRYMLYRFREGHLKGQREFTALFPSVIGTDRGGDVWIGSSSGLYKFNVQEFPQREFTHLTTVNGLPSLDTGTGVTDREDNLWVVNAGKAILKLSEHSILRFTTKAFFVYGNAGAVRDSRHHLWLPSNTGLFEAFQENSGNWTTQVHESRGKQEGAQCLVQLAGDSFYGLVDNRISLYDIDRKGNYSRVVLRLNVPIHDSSDSYVAIVDHANRLWKGLSGVGVEVADVKTGALLYTYSTKDNLPGSSPLAIYQDKKGNVWLGTEDATEGALAVHWAGDSIGAPLTRYRRAEGFPYGRVTRLFEDTDGRLWIGTRYEGLVVRDGSRFKNISTKDGLHSNAILCIAEDSVGRIWVGTHTGLESIDMKSLRPLPLKQELVGVIYNCGVMENGIVWGAGANTFLVYDYGQEKRDKVPPLVHVVSATSNGTALRLDEHSELQYDQNNVAVEFVGIGFRDEKAMRYEFILEGADKGWGASSAQRRINYAALKPGRYKFLVKAITGEGIASTATASLSFGILPPFWQRGWFVTLSVLIMGLLLYALYRYRLRQLLAMERMRMAIATDLHDDIGTSLTRIALYADASLRELGDRPGHSANEKSRTLNELLKDIGGTSRTLVDAMSDIVWAVDPKNDSFENVLIRMKTLAARMFDAKGIDYYIQIAPDLSPLEMPLQYRRHFFLVFKEAVNNIIKHSRATRVDLSINRTNGMLVMDLQDNGIGFDTASPKEGNGLRNMKERARALGGEYTVTSDQGTGTKVHCTMRIA